MGIKLTRILYNILKEEEEESSTSVADNLKRFKALRYVLQDLLTSSKEDDYDRTDDITKLIKDIEVIAFKPTTFKIVFKSDASMNLKYDPTPMEMDPTNKSDFKPRDFFECQIMGKKYNLGNRSEFEQALKYISRAMANKPVGSGNNQSTKDQNNPDDEPEDTTDDQ